MGMFSSPRRAMNRMPIKSANVGIEASTPQNPRPVTPRVGPNTYAGPAPVTSAQTNNSVPKSPNPIQGNKYALVSPKLRSQLEAAANFNDPWNTVKKTHALQPSSAMPESMKDPEALANIARQKAQGTYKPPTPMPFIEESATGNKRGGKISLKDCKINTAEKRNTKHKNW